MLSGRARPRGEVQQGDPRESHQGPFTKRTAGDGSAAQHPSCKSEELRSSYSSHIAMMEAILDTKVRAWLERCTCTAVSDMKANTKRCFTSVVPHPK